MSTSTTIANTFGKAARSYDEYAGFQRNVIDHLYHSINNDITPNKTLLDAGCGTGYFQEVLRKYGHKNTLTQIDISPAMCDIADEYAAVPSFATTHTICCDVQNLPFRDASFDIVLSSLTLQWIALDELEETLKHLILTLKPGGTFAISIIGEHTLQELASFDSTLANPFIKKETWEHIASKLPLSKHHTGEFTQTLFYQNSRQLLHSIKGIGASRLTGTQKPRSKNFFSELENHYQTQYRQERGLPATWQALTLVGKV